MKKLDYSDRMYVEDQLEMKLETASEMMSSLHVKLRQIVDALNELSDLLDEIEDQFLHSGVIIESTKRKSKRNKV